MAQNAVSALQVPKARTSAGLVVNAAIGLMTATSVVNAVNVVAEAAEVASAEMTVVEGVIHAIAEADPHPVTGTIDAEVEAGQARAALKSYAKAVASSAMRRATSSATALSTVVVVVVVVVVVTAPLIVEDDSKIAVIVEIVGTKDTEDPPLGAQGAAVPEDTMTVAVGTWVDTWGHLPADNTQDHRLLKRTTDLAATAVIEETRRL